jgi:hypothetical protein
VSEEDEKLLEKNKLLKMPDFKSRYINKPTLQSEEGIKSIYKSGNNNNVYDAELFALDEFKFKHNPNPNFFRMQQEKDIHDSFENLGFGEKINHNAGTLIIVPLTLLH